MLNAKSPRADSCDIDFSHNSIAAFPADSGQFVVSEASMLRTTQSPSYKRRKSKPGIRRDTLYLLRAKRGSLKWQELRCALHPPPSVTQRQL